MEAIGFTEKVRDLFLVKIAKAKVKVVDKGNLRVFAN